MNSMDFVQKVKDITKSIPKSDLYFNVQNLKKNEMVKFLKT